MPRTPRPDRRKPTRRPFEPKKVLRHCLLCGAEPHERCLWVPHDQATLQTPKGRFRGIAYALCKTCAAKPNVWETVERIVLREFRLFGTPSGVN
jgi:hypothetical protein